MRLPTSPRPPRTMTHRRACRRRLLSWRIPLSVVAGPDVSPSSWMSRSIQPLSATHPRVGKKLTRATPGCPTKSVAWLPPSLRRNDVGVAIRERQEADLAACTQLASLVQDIDGYPPYLPRGQMSEFIQSPDAIAAWVAEVDADLVGHVALHSQSSQAVMSLASTTLETPTQGFAVVARLFVSPAARRTGVGRSLLETAAAHAVSRGLRPILDVVTHFQSAITLYESCGWTRVGMVTVALRDGNSIDEFVYFAPSLWPRPDESTP